MNLLSVETYQILHERYGCGQDRAVDGPGVRLLIASQLGDIVAPAFREIFGPGLVTVAVDEAAVRSAIADNLRYDVVLTDLTWQRVELEFAFDGLDVLDIVQRLGRPAPVLFALQGHNAERDHLDEAVARDGVAGTIAKAGGVPAMASALREVAAGRFLPMERPVKPTIHRWFMAGRRGETAARMAGAIAAGRAANHDTLAAAAKCSRNTAVKVAEKYLGPLIRERGEHAEDLPLTTRTVYRRCGEHARYLISWCRRNGHAEVLGSR
jgi:DNA-binding NarL/FixJ family response regulator